MRARDTRLELAALAVALLLPIPLFVASGLRLPLPDAVERGLASLESGGAFDSAVIEAPPATPRAGTAPAPAAGSARPSATPPKRRATSSAALVVERRETPTGGGRDGAEPGGGGGGADADGDDRPQGEPRPDAPALPPKLDPSDPAGDTGVATTVDAAPGGPIELDVSDEGVEIDAAGESVDVPVPGVPLPDVSAPTPLPLP